MRFSILITFVLILSACSNRKEEIVERLPEPENLIPRQEMTSVLLEMAKLEGYIQSQYGSVDKYHKVMLKSGDSLLSTFNISPDQYEKSLLYYGSRQSLMQEINDDVLDELTRELGELESSSDSTLQE